MHLDLNSLFSGLAGVLVGAVITYILQHRLLDKQLAAADKSHIRTAKFDTARRLFGYRHSIMGDGFSTAMNEVFVVFGDSPSVMRAMGGLYGALSAPGKPMAEDALISFLKAICDDLGIDYSTLNDSYFIKTFNARN